MPSTFPSRIEQIEGERYASSRARQLFKTSEFCVCLINLTKTLQGWHIKESFVVELNAAKSWKRKFNNVKLLFSQFLRNLYLPFVIFWKKRKRKKLWCCYLMFVETGITSMKAKGWMSWVWVQFETVVRFELELNFEKCFALFLSSTFIFQLSFRINSMQFQNWTWKFKITSNFWTQFLINIKHLTNL